MSVLEERRAQRGWGADASVQFIAALKRALLRPISQLNEGFVRPRFPGRDRVQLLPGVAVLRDGREPEGARRRCRRCWRPIATAWDAGGVPAVLGTDRPQRWTRSSMRGCGRSSPCRCVPSPPSARSPAACRWRRTRQPSGTRRHGDARRRIHRGDEVGGGGHGEEAARLDARAAGARADAVSASTRAMTARPGAGPARARPRRHGDGAVAAGDRHRPQ